jgi:peptide/nickel transport system ATP-binding protein
MPIASQLAVGQVKNLKTYYKTNIYGIKRTVRAVDGVSFEIEKNEILGIAGESSCGKSTLVKALCGVIKRPLTVEGGTVQYNFGDKIFDMFSSNEDELKAVRWKHISYVLQGSMGALNSVRKIIKSFEDFRNAHQKIRNRRNFRDSIERHLDTLGLPPEVLDSYPHQLSGGMKQRVTIALATIFDPEVILADEPTTALDVIVQRGVLRILRKIQERSRSTIVLVTHDMSVHAKMDTRVGIMYAGELVEIAKTRNIFENPTHPYTKHLINALPRIGEKAKKGSLPGAPPSLAEPPSGCKLHPRCPEAMDICRNESPQWVEVGKDHFARCFLLSESEKK